MPENGLSAADHVELFLLPLRRCASGLHGAIWLHEELGWFGHRHPWAWTVERAGRAVADGEQLIADIAEIELPPSDVDGVRSVVRLAERVVKVLSTLREPAASAALPPGFPLDAYLSDLLAYLLARWMLTGLPVVADLLGILGVIAQSDAWEEEAFDDLGGWRQHRPRVRLRWARVAALCTDPSGELRRGFLSGGATGTDWAVHDAEDACRLADRVLPPLVRLLGRAGIDARPGYLPSFDEPEAGPEPTEEAIASDDSPSPTGDNPELPTADIDEPDPWTATDDWVPVPAAAADLPPLHDGPSDAVPFAEARLDHLTALSVLLWDGSDPAVGMWVRPLPRSEQEGGRDCVAEVGLAGTGTVTAFEGAVHARAESRIAVWVGGASVALAEGASGGSAEISVRLGPAPERETATPSTVFQVSDWAFEGVVKAAIDGSGTSAFDASLSGRFSGRFQFTCGDGADNFLSSQLPATLLAPFEVSAGWSTAGGPWVEGAAGLELVVPLDLWVAESLCVHHICFLLSVGSDGLEASATLGLSLRLGPLVVSVDDVGVYGALAIPAGGGNLGPLDLSGGFKPPEGLGLSLDAAVAKGGGYLTFDADAGRYEGILELSLIELADVVAIVVIDTKPPEGAFSLLAALFATFDEPGLELGMSVKLLGVGGLFGLNRRVDVEAMKRVFREGRAGALLFPDDPIANATTILRDLDAVFPVRAGRFVFGPAIKLGFGYPTLFTAELGVFVELPSFERILLLGSLSMLLPEPETALVRLTVDVLGTIDFGAKKATLDGALRSSRILMVDIEGDMALRISWGDDADFLLSIGGFHPSFVPSRALDVPELKRLKVSLGYEGDGIRAMIAKEMYVAITTNTVQLGYKESARVEISGVGGVSGHYEIHALLRFNPFAFIVTLQARFKVWALGITLAALEVDGELSGPNPWRIYGRCKVSVLFFSVTVRFDVRFGDEIPEERLPRPDPLTLLREQVVAPERWSSGRAPSSSVPLRAGREKQWLRPDAELRFLQGRVPLDVDIQRIDQVDLAAPVRLRVETPGTPEVIEGPFPMGQFLQLSDAQKLALPPQQDKVAGFAVRSSAAIPVTARRSVELEPELTLMGSEATEPFPLDATALVAAHAALTRVRRASARSLDWS